MKAAHRLEVELDDIEDGEMLTPEELAWRFAHHPAQTPEKVKAHEDCRQWFTVLAHAVNTTLPEGREKRISLMHLQEALMWADAALSCDRGGSYWGEGTTP